MCSNCQRYYLKNKYWDDELAVDLISIGGRKNWPVFWEREIFKLRPEDEKSAKAKLETLFGGGEVAFSCCERPAPASDVGFAPLPQCDTCSFSNKCIRSAGVLGTPHAQWLHASNIQPTPPYIEVERELTKLDLGSSKMSSSPYGSSGILTIHTEALTGSSHR